VVFGELANLFQDADGFAREIRAFLLKNRTVPFPTILFTFQPFIKG